MHLFVCFEECNGNGSVVWTTGRLTGRLAYCVLWLDQETEDKVAVGLIATHLFCIGSPQWCSGMSPGPCAILL